MASNTTYNRNTWQEVHSNVTQPYNIGIQGSADPLTITSFYLTLTDDIFIRGVEVVYAGATMGDTITLSVIDTNGITGVPPGTMIACPVNGWNLSSGAETLRYTSLTPRKALATMKLKVDYNNTGNSSVIIGINFNCLKILM